ncbi:MAG: rhomboid family intramembrane serine protease [Thermoanaerobaculales bacterium]|jgi:rhomboid-like protein|nr:rhomboid family intramembrane serine protease [Thermoanaerobaculales bacterium]
MNAPYHHAAQPFPDPPPRRRRPRAPVVVAIVALNILVFLAWQAATVAPALQVFMVTNFLVSTTHLLHGMVWTLLSSAFSHSELWHLVLNMFVLWSFGTVLERLWGSRTFLLFYLAAAAVASFCHCLGSSLLMHNPDIPALGASGAVSGLLLAYALIFPRHRILLFGVIPVPALAGVLAFVGIDLWGLVAQSRGGGLPIGHGAHLGGALAGALMYLLVLRRRMPRAPTAPRAPLLAAEEAAEFERIRMKIEAEGPHSLNPKERDFLDRLRARVAEAQLGAERDG